MIAALLAALRLGDGHRFLRLHTALGDGVLVAETLQGRFSGGRAINYRRVCRVCALSAGDDEDIPECINSRLLSFFERSCCSYSRA